MMRRIADSAPASIIATASGAVALGLRPFPASIESLLQYPLSVIWIWLLFIGCFALVSGVWLRTVEHSRRRVIGLGCELGGGIVAAGMPFIYGLVIGFAVGWGAGFLSIAFMWALASTFFFPWLLTCVTAIRAVPAPPGGKSVLP